MLKGSEFGLFVNREGVEFKVFCGFDLSCHHHVLSLQKIAYFLLICFFALPWLTFPNFSLKHKDSGPEKRW